MPSTVLERSTSDDKILLVDEVTVLSASDCPLSLTSSSDGKLLSDAAAESLTVDPPC